MSIFCQNSTVFWMQGIMWIVLDRYTWIIINYKMLRIVYDFILFSVGLFFYRTFGYKREFLWVKAYLNLKNKTFFFFAGSWKLWYLYSISCSVLKLYVLFLQVLVDVHADPNLLVTYGKTPYFYWIWCILVHLLYKWMSVTWTQGIRHYEL